jgi:hypothetical protein
VARYYGPVSLGKNRQRTGRNFDTSFERHRVVFGFTDVGLSARTAPRPLRLITPEFYGRVEAAFPHPRSSVGVRTFTLRLNKPGTSPYKDDSRRVGWSHEYRRASSFTFSLNLGKPNSQIRWPKAAQTNGDAFRPSAEISPAAVRLGLECRHCPRDSSGISDLKAADFHATTSAPRQSRVNTRMSVNVRHKLVFASLYSQLLDPTRVKRVLPLRARPAAPALSSTSCPRSASTCLKTWASRSFRSIAASAALDKKRPGLSWKQLGVQVRILQFSLGDGPKRTSRRFDDGRRKRLGRRFFVIPLTANQLSNRSLPALAATQIVAALGCTDRARVMVLTRSGSLWLEQNFLGPGPPR